MLFVVLAVIYFVSFIAFKQPRVRFPRPSQPASAVTSATSRPALTNPSLAQLPPDRQARILHLFNQIEDFGHEFEAALQSRNQLAAQTGVQRLSSLLGEFNSVAADTGLQFPPALLEAVARVKTAADAGDWSALKTAAAHDPEFAREFKRIGQAVRQLALQTNSPPHDF
jgi:hypothetical protein